MLNCRKILSSASVFAACWLIPMGFFLAMEGRAIGGILLSSSVVSQGNPQISDPTLFNLSLQNPPTSTLNVGQQLTNFNYQVSSLGAPPSSSPYSYAANYSSTTTITDTTVNQMIGILVVEGSGIGSYFTDNRIAINNNLGSVTVNGHAINFNQFTDTSSRFTIQRGTNFTNFSFVNFAQSEFNNPSIGGRLPSSFLRLDSTSNVYDPSYQLITAVPEPSSISLAVLASLLGIARLKNHRRAKSTSA